MEALKQTMEIPANHKLTIDIPGYIKEKYAEILIIFKDNDISIKSTNDNTELFITDKVKSISGIIKSDKDYKELLDDITDERIKKYENLL